MKNKLFSFFIKYDSEFTSLTTMAFSQLILKIMIAEDKAVTLPFLKNAISQITRMNVKENQLREIIKLLINKGNITTDKRYYALSPKIKKELQEEIKHYESLNEAVMNKWFSKAASNNQDVYEWFQDVMVKVFEKFRYEWIQEICNINAPKKKGSFNFEEIMKQELTKHKKILKEDYEWLKKQFYSFFDSNDNDENQVIWLYGTSMFSATLIASTEHGDNITFDTIRDSNFLLDTNVMMILYLDGSQLTPSLVSLETALKALNISIHYLYISRDEYLNAIESKRLEIKNVFEKYSLEVLKSTDDDFVQTAIKRNCKTPEDIDVFFDSMLDIPKYFYSELPLNCLEDDKIDKAIIEADGNEQLHKQIDEIQIERFGSPKKEKNRIHDARLLTSVRKLREEGKYWIISRDGTVIKYALKNNIRDEYPVAIGLDVLINLIAVNPNAGMIDSDTFAPLFANIIKMALIPERKAFCVEDLSYILDARMDINKLPNEKVIELAKEVNQKRLEGTPDEEIRLHLRREFQRNKLEYIDDAEQAKIRAVAERIKREEAEGEVKVYKKGYMEKSKELNKVINSLHIAGYLTLLLLCLLFTSSAIYFYINYYISDPSAGLSMLLGLIIELLGGILGLYWVITKKLWKLFSERKEIGANV